MGKPAPVDVQHVDTQHQLQPDSTYTPPSPSIALLFSYCSRRDALLGVCPAVLVSLAAGGIAPFMTHVIGQAFQALATFTTADDPHARQQLTHTMGIVALELVGLALGTLAFSSLMSSIWLWLGERIVRRLRHEVFMAVTTREIEWFDLLGENKSDKDDESIGAGGLMAKFAR
jgi:ATP-binding cassette subfamily B (MDR/TAP) protein 1